jgi:hypothetical protein
MPCAADHRQQIEDLGRPVGRQLAGERRRVPKREDAAVEEVGRHRVSAREQVRELVRPGGDLLLVSPVVAIADADEPVPARGSPAAHLPAERIAERMSVNGDERIGIVDRDRLEWELELKARVERELRRGAQHRLDEPA